jgi:hypothetical protein
MISLNDFQETTMNQFTRPSVYALAILGSITSAAAQQATGNPHQDLTSSQSHMVSQGLVSAPSQQQLGGAQPQVGNKLPDSMTAEQLPQNVTDQVPETKGLFFVKLPDRIVLIDPDTQLVTEIVPVMDATTTGSNPKQDQAPGNATDQSGGTSK